MPPLRTDIRAAEEKGYVGRDYLGLGPLPLRGSQGGLVVSEVSPDGPGAAAGFVVGNIIPTWDGAPLRSMRGWRPGLVRRRSGGGSASGCCAPAPRSKSR
jgi:S1-C subfamily serine protease